MYHAISGWLRGKKVPVTLGFECWHDQSYFVRFADVQSDDVIYESLVQSVLRQKIDVQLEDERHRYIRHRDVSQIVDRIKFLCKENSE